MEVNDHKPLKLRAEHPTDIKIISACLQDSILPASQMHFDRDQNIFHMIANRFCWEHEPADIEGDPLYKRIHAGLHFGHVDHVKHQGMDPDNPNKVHNFLAMHGDKEGEIHMIFSNDCRICMHVQKVYCVLHDIHEPWWTHQKPLHEQAA